MKNKASKFNILHEVDGNQALFNSRTTACIVLKGAKQEFDWLLKGDSKAFEDNWKTTSDKLKKELVKGGFVIDSGFDEYSFMRIQQQVQRYSHRVVGLSILPTLGCNLACTYCYEEKKQGTLSEESQDRIVTYIDNAIREGTKKVQITWYGGEPLLEFDIIRNISKRLMSLCKANNVEYDAGMTTNGTLLTPSLAREMKEMGIGKSQISIDGPRDIHDSRRPFGDGRGSFDAITKYIKEISDIIHLTVRINLDRNNLPRAREAVDAIAALGLNKKTYVYYSPVHAEGKWCQDVKRFCNEKLICDKEFSKLEPELFKYGESKGVIRWELPDHLPRACTAIGHNSLVIEPDGTLQKCYVTIGYEDEAVGNLREGLVYNKKLLNWLNFEPFQIPKCQSCNVMPLCWGGCPYRMMQDTSAETCRSIKFNIKKIIERIASEFIENKTPTIISQDICKSDLSAGNEILT